MNARLAGDAAAGARRDAAAALVRERTGRQRQIRCHRTTWSDRRPSRRAQSLAGEQPGRLPRTRGLASTRVEFDVHQTRDGGLVVIHDPTLERTTAGHGAGRRPHGSRACDHAAARRRRGGRADVSTRCSMSSRTPTSSFTSRSRPTPSAIPIRAWSSAWSTSSKRRGLEHRAILTCFVPEVMATVRRLSPQARVLASLDRRSAEMMGGISPALDRLAAIPTASSRSRRRCCR